MKRYIRSSNYDYYEFLDDKKRYGFLRAVAQKATEYGLKADYLDEFGFRNPANLGGENQPWSNNVAIMLDGAEIADYTISGYKDYIQIYGDKPRKFKSFVSALKYMDKELRSLV